jgi:predicted unusual protein kinase regulating ubiquinone biosynthesis (AarF/ABC1/UbiB family)
MKAHLSGYPKLVVPAALRDLSGSRVLTMERIYGNKITALSPVVLIDVEGEELARQLFEAYLDQILVHGFVHVDPHPGNVLLTRDHRLALLDLGMVATTSRTFRQHVLQLLVAAIEGDGEGAAAAAMVLGTPSRSFDREELRNRTTELVEGLRYRPVENRRLGGVVIEVAQIATQPGPGRLPGSRFPGSRDRESG